MRKGEENVEKEEGREARGKRKEKRKQEEEEETGEAESVRKEGRVSVFLLGFPLFL